ncbi:anti-sigma factor family protein [Streptomyces chumphonensis]|uniref:anti-sigma factor family protein n=1 Tax=Streptomyces chumphonensis TaxID=1214925 RepID=UPI003D746177
MTASFSTPDRNDHPEVEDIADLAEGLLAPEHAVQVRAHLQRCRPCSEVRDALAAVQGELRELNVPEPMPEDVVARIEAALSSEAAQPPRPAVRSPKPSADPGSHVSRETRRPSGTSGAATGPGRPRPRRRAWVGRRTALLSTAGALAVAALGGVLVSGVLTSDSTNDPPSVAQPQEEAAGDERLEDQVRALLAAPTTSPGTRPDPDSKTPEGPSAQGDPNLPFTTETAPAVPPCVERAVGRIEQPIALGEESYQGTAAYLVVLPHPGDESRVDAYVVDASCVTQAPQGEGRQLAFRTVERS